MRGRGVIGIALLVALLAVGFAGNAAAGRVSTTAGSRLTATGSQFAAYQTIPVGSFPDAVAIGDVTGDGRNDVVMTTWYHNDPANDFRLFVFVGQPSGALASPVSYATSANLGALPESVAVGDVTGDGRADVILALNGYGIQVFPQLPSGLLGSPTVVQMADTYKIRLGRLNDDDALDVAGVGWGKDTVSVLLNDGHGSFAAPVKYVAQHGGREDLEVADVSGDGRDDLVVMSGQLYAVPQLSVLTQLPGGGFGPAVEYRVGSHVLTTGVGVGDITGDGRNDVVLTYGGNRPSSFVAVLAQNGSGALDAPVSYPSADVPGAVDVADLDLDGRADAVTLHDGWSSAGVYHQQPDGTLAGEQLYGIPYASSYNPHGLALGDVTNDGLPDAVIADYNHGLVVLRNTHVFAPPPPPPPPPPVVPQQPAIDSVTVAGDGSVTIDWTSPGWDGGSPITGYRVYRRTGSGMSDLVATVGTATEYTDTTAPPGLVAYRISAVNSAGEGPQSKEHSTAPGDAPGPPSSESVDSGDHRVTLTWSAPDDDGGSPILGYRVYRYAVYGEPLAVFDVGIATTFTDTALVNGAFYDYTVSALNAVGEGADSNGVVGEPAGPPDAPLLTRAEGEYRQVTIYWELERSDDNPFPEGGSRVTSWAIYRATEDGPMELLATVTEDELGGSYTDTTTEASTAYRYEVAAVNALGEGEPSNEQTGISWTSGRVSTGVPVPEPRPETPPFTPPGGGVRPPVPHQPA